MFFSVDEFRGWSNKCITLLGMSGVGKTHLSNMLRHHHWFHYSGDYRIGTRYMDEDILDSIKQQAMQNVALRNLLRNDYIYIRNNLTVDNLGSVISFLGKVGNPDKGGLPLIEFKRRQQLYKMAEIAAMLDVPEFIKKAREVYGYEHFVNDVGGSLCELDDDQVMKTLTQHSLILYIQVKKEDERILIERAAKDPKPLYYRSEFLDEYIDIYLKEKQLEYLALADPDDFIRWVFPHLFHARIPRYESIADQHGYVVSADDVDAVRDDQDFTDLVEQAIDRRHTPVKKRA